MRIGLIAGAVGLVAGIPALASPSPKTDIRAYEADGRPVTPEFPFRDGKAGRQLGGMIMSSSFGNVTRFSDGDGERQATITLTDSFDVAANGYAPGSGNTTVASGTAGLPVLPTGINGGGRRSLSSVWSGTGAPANNGDTQSVISSAQSPPFAGITNENAGGNTTFKLRIFTASQQAAGGFFTGANYNYVQRNSGGGTGTLTNIGQRFVFTGTASANSRQILDTYVTAITTIFTSEAIYVSSGYIIDRLLWGGTNTTTGVGLPVGPIPSFYSLGPNPAAFLTGIFVPCTLNAVTGGTLAPTPVASWFKIIHENDPSFRVIIKIDANGAPPYGAGEVKIYDNIGINVGRTDRHATNSSFEHLNDAVYYDNLTQTGVQFIIPTPPDLVCNSGNYTDNLSWLNTGPLFGQGTRWVDALSSKATVQASGSVVWGGLQYIRQINQFPNDLTREEFRTTLPTTYATSSPFSVCVDLLIPNTVSNVTPHNVSPQSIADGFDVTRMFIGFYDGVNPFTSRVAIQTDPNFNPIDAEDSTTPFAPTGTPPTGGNYVVGTSAALTGFSWPNTAGSTAADRRTVCFTVDNTRNLTVSVGGTNIYTGTAFTNSVDRLAFENKNNTGGNGNSWQVGNVVLTCQTLPLVVLPALTLVYSDNLEWANLGITIGANRETTNPLEIFRWASAASSPVVQGFGAGNTTKVLKISNTLRTFAPVAPSDPTYATALGTDARTILPQVIAGSTRGWVARADLALTDDLSSRDFQIGETTPAGIPNFYLVTDLAFSSVTKTFWVRTPILPLPAAAPFTTFTNTGATLSTLGLSLNTWFNLSIHRNLNGTFTYRFNGKLLRDGTGAPVIGQQLQTRDGANVVSPKNLNAWFTASPDDNTAPANGSSQLYVDNIRAWALPCIGDTNNDGVVNFTDLNNVLGFFGQTGANQDITGNVAPDPTGQGFPTDNAVNFNDLNAVLSGFGVPCT